MARLDVGICFGGSSITVAFNKDQKSSLIVNEAGDRSTPSFISVNENEVLVGLPAKQNRIRNTKNTMFNMIHFIDKNADQIESESVIKKLDVEYKVNSENEFVFLIEKNEKQTEMKLNEALETLFKYVLELTRTSQSVKLCDAVLSAPRYFNESQKQFLIDCAKKIGFNVLGVISNPVAACLAYTLEEDNSSDSTILVYQMGGSTIECSLLYLSNGLYRLIDSVNTVNLGGDQFTDIVVDILCEEFQRKNKLNPRTNKRSLFKLKTNAEELKHILSTMERAHCSIDALFDGIDFDYYLTRQRFESVCLKIYSQVLQPIDDLLKANNLNESQVNQVILCGASTKMCKIQLLIKEKFLQSKLLSHLSPDEIVALGCAKQCALITNSRKKDISKQDCFFKSLKNSISIQTGKNGKLQEVFKQNAPIPLKKIFDMQLDLTDPNLYIVESNEKLISTINLTNKFSSKEINIVFQIKMDETIELAITEILSGEKEFVFLNLENTNETD